MKIIVSLFALGLLIFLNAFAVNAGYSSSQSTQNLFLSYAAYCNESSLMSFNCKWCSSFGASNPDFGVFRVLSNSTFDNFGFVGFDARDNYIYVSYRGTVESDNKNWLEDIKDTKTSAFFAPGAAIHDGFLLGYLSMSQQTLSAVNMLLEQHPTATIIATGHSLGAALATLFAVDFATLNPSVPIQLWTYGSPRVGNDIFVEFVQKLSNIKTIWRVVNHKDLVPHLPPEIAFFRHVTTEVWYTDSSHFQVCSSTNGEDPNCSDSIFFPDSVSDHLDYLGFQEGCKR